MTERSFQRLSLEDCVGCCLLIMLIVGVWLSRAVGSVAVDDCCTSSDSSLDELESLPANIALNKSIGGLAASSTCKVIEINTYNIDNTRRVPP